jgi:hypothetical protein
VSIVGSAASRRAWPVPRLLWQEQTAFGCYNLICCSKASLQVSRVPYARAAPPSGSVFSTQLKLAIKRMNLTALVSASQRKRERPYVPGGRVVQEQLCGLQTLEEIYTRTTC